MNSSIAMIPSKNKVRVRWSRGRVLIQPICPLSSLNSHWAGTIKPRIRGRERFHREGDISLRPSHHDLGYLISCQVRTARTEAKIHPRKISKKSISLNNGNISYNIHTKNLRNHYLNASSCHPEHIIENIPYTEALRYSRNNSDRDYLQIQLETLFKDLLSNGYKTNNIRTKFGRALLKERNLKITKKPTKKKKIKEQSVFLKVPYHPTTAPIIKKKLKNIMRWLESTYAGASWKSNFPTKIITSNKLPPKIGEILKN